MAEPILALRGYRRTGSFPLDSTTYFEDYEEALDYIHKDGSVYAGQVISLNDALRKKVKMYYVTYDTDKDAEFKYKLEEIGAGASGGSGFINYKGKLESYTELLEIEDPKPNDMYYVRNDITAGYTAYIYQDESWTRVDLGISVATARNDGIITKEMYKSLISNTEAIYFSPGSGNPDENKFISFDTTGNTDSLRVMSTDKVRETIYTLVSANEPEVTITTTPDISDVLAGSGFHDIYIRVHYKKNRGGDIIRAELTSGYMATEILTDEDFEYDQATDSYIYTKVLYGITIVADQMKNYISASIEYDENKSTLTPAGRVTGTFAINAYQRFDYRYGYYKDSLMVYTKNYYLGSDAPRAKENTSYNVDIKPDSENGMNRFDILTPYPLKELYYVEEDIDILPKTSVVYTSDGYLYNYETYLNYAIYGSMHLVART